MKKKALKGEDGRGHKYKKETKTCSTTLQQPTVHLLLTDLSCQTKKNDNKTIAKYVQYYLLSMKTCLYQ